MEKVVDLFGVGEADSQKLLEGGNDLSEIEQVCFSIPLISHFWNLFLDYKVPKHR